MPEMTPVTLKDFKVELIAAGDGIATNQICSEARDVGCSLFMTLLILDIMQE
jgi:hypothetical protein